MGYYFGNNQSRFSEPDDEPDYSGVSAENVAIDELVMPDGSILAIEIEANFTHDGNNWIADGVWLKTFTRTQDGERFQFMDKWTIASAENGFGGIVDACENWADKNLSPEDYCDA